MFKNHAFQVQMVKKNGKKNQTETDEALHVDPELINTIVKDQVQNAALAVGSVVLASKLLNTVSEIAIIAAKAKFK